MATALNKASRVRVDFTRFFSFAVARLITMTAKTSWLRRHVLIQRTVRGRMPSQPPRSAVSARPASRSPARRRRSLARAGRNAVLELGVAERVGALAIALLLPGGAAGIAALDG